jgi:MGT family glycosyltransferase
VGAEGILGPSVLIKSQMRCEIVPPSGSIVSDFRDEGGNELSPLDRLIRLTMSSVASRYDVDRPDLIIYDFVALAGRILANRLGIPAIQTSPVFAHDPDRFFEQVKNPLWRDQLLWEGKTNDECLKRYGVEGTEFVFHREKLNIYLFPRPIQPEGNFLGRNFFYAGRCAAERPSHGDYQARDTGGKPVCFIVTSTSYLREPAFYKMFIEAFRDGKWHVIMSLGDICDPEDLGDVTGNFELIKNVDNTRILPHANLFISQGGIVSESEALFHGVPLLILSCGFLELEWQAENVEELGLGVHLMGAEMNAKTIRQAADRMAGDQGLRERVGEISRRIRREAGAEETADRIEEFLAEERRG